MVENPLENAGDTDLIPGSGRPPGEGNATFSSIPAWEMPWTEEPGWLQPIGLQSVVHDLVTKQQHVLMTPNFYL